MPAEGIWTISCALTAPPPQGSISNFSPAQQLEDTLVASTGGTVAQIRVELEDHTEGVGDVPEVNIEIFPAQGSMTATAATDIITTGAAHGQVIGNQVSFASSGTLPAGLTAGTKYYVVDVPSTTEIKVSATSGGSVLNITDAGTGSHTWRGYGQIAVSYTYGGGTSNVIPIEGGDGEDNDFDTLRGIHLKISTLDPDDSVASAKITVEGGDPTDEFNYFCLPLRFSTASGDTDSAAALVLPRGIQLDPGYPIIINIVQSDNCQLLMALQGT